MPLMRSDSCATASVPVAIPDTVRFMVPDIIQFARLYSRLILSLRMVRLRLPRGFPSRTDYIMSVSRSMCLWRVLYMVWLPVASTTAAKCRPFTSPPRTTPAGLCGSVSCLMMCNSSMRYAWVVYRAVLGVTSTGLNDFMSHCSMRCLCAYDAKSGDAECAIVQSFRRHNRCYRDTIIPGTIRHHIGVVLYDTPACRRSVVYGAAPIRRGTFAQPVIWCAPFCEFPVTHHIQWFDCLTRNHTFGMCYMQTSNSRVWFHFHLAA